MSSVPKNLFTILVICVFCASLASPRPQIETASDGISNMCYPLLHDVNFSTLQLPFLCYRYFGLFTTCAGTITQKMANNKKYCAGTGLAVATIGAMGSSVVTGMMLARSPPSLRFIISYLILIIFISHWHVVGQVFFFLSFLPGLLHILSS